MLTSSICLWHESSTGESGEVSWRNHWEQTATRRGPGQSTLLVKGNTYRQGSHSPLSQPMLPPALRKKIPQLAKQNREAQGQLLPKRRQTFRLRQKPLILNRRALFAHFYSHAFFAYFKMHMLFLHILCIALISHWHIYIFYILHPCWSGSNCIVISFGNSSLRCYAQLQRIEIWFFLNLI